MASRKGAIIELAERSSMLLIEALPSGREVAKGNYRKIAAVCRALLSNAKTPYLPTAALVAEEGGNLGDASFPSARTIHNVYSDMMRIWKRAHSDITNIMAEDAIAINDLPNIDLQDADANTKHVFDELYRHLLEAHQRNNALKRIITESVPVDADNIPSTSGRVIESLAWWIDMMKSGLFLFDDDGLKVSKKTPIGTIIIDAETMGELQTLVDDFRSAEKKRRSQGG